MQALVIDDSRTMRGLMKQVLTQAGYEIHEAENGREGLTRLSQLGPVALVLVDWNMPVMNGYEFICAVRANPIYDRLRLIMVTTEADDAKRQAALQAGANAYVLKPFSPQQLLESIVSTSLSKRSVMQAMVIDDSRVTRMILGQILKSMGFEVAEASDGAKALQGLKEQPGCRLALVDCNMPEMDGSAVVRAVRADPAWKELCLVMVTGEEDETQIQHCLKEGANGFIRKPFTREQIQAKLQHLGVVS